MQKWINSWFKFFRRLKNRRLAEAKLFLFLPLPHPIFSLSFLLAAIFHPFFLSPFIIFNGEM